jgi:neutral trehalase
MPLFIRIASPERAARVAKVAADPAKFFPGMPTAAYDTPGYESRGYWRGSTWLNTSYFSLKGLQEYGHDQLAEKMRSTLLTWMSRNPSDLFEHYDSKTGEGEGAKGLAGLSQN